MTLLNEATSMATFMEVNGSKLTFVEASMEVDLLPWKLVGLAFVEISSEKKLLPGKLVEASMEVDLLPCKLVEVSVEVDGNFHGSRLKKQLCERPGSR